MADIITFPEIPGAYNSVLSRNGKHHKTSCNWYDWQSKSNHITHIPKPKQITAPSDLFEYRNNRLVNTKSLQNRGIKDSCLSNWEGDILSKRTVVPGGEARDYNIYAFSQHDNRHKICLPAKKTDLCNTNIPNSPHIHNVKVLNQARSANVTETLNWDHKNPGNNDGFNRFHYQRKTADNEIENFLAPGKSKKEKLDLAKHRRFPKTHDDSLEKFSIFTKENETNCILNHSHHHYGANNQSVPRAQTVLDKKDLINLQSLCQPQFYTGSKLVNARAAQPPKLLPGRKQGPASSSRKSQSAIGTMNSGWNYSFHTHTHSKRVGDSTRNACYRF